MTTNSLSLYNSVLKPKSMLLELPVLLTFNLLLVATSYISINLPFSPVPITGQTFGVLVIAMALGCVRGSAVVMAYLLEGAAGFPVFAGGTAGLAKLLGPTGGYLFGFLVSAFITGYLADRGWDRKYFTSIMAMIVGTAIIFALGLAGLSLFSPDETLLSMGLYPFLPGAVLKIVIASAVLPSVWRFIGKK